MVEIGVAMNRAGLAGWHLPYVFIHYVNSFKQ